MSDTIATPAPLTRAVGAYHNGTLFILAEGDNETGCYTVDIEPSPLTVQPPRFSVVRYRQAGACIEVITPYRKWKAISLGYYPEIIIIDHAGGESEVKVDRIEKPASDFHTMTFADAGGEVPVPYLAPPSAFGENVDEAVGYSEAHSFDEALANARAALPNEGNILFERVRVTEIGTEFGGFVGANHLFVRVRRVSPA